MIRNKATLENCIYLVRLGNTLNERMEAFHAIMNHNDALIDVLQRIIKTAEATYPEDFKRLTVSLCQDTIKQMK